MINYVFDVDGTLTSPREKMDPEFQDWFWDWMMGKRVYLLTGSDAEKTIGQVGAIWSWLVSYQCSGNEIWVEGIQVYKFIWDFYTMKEVESFCRELLKESPYPTKTGNHIEARTGMINFSSVGRNASPKERHQYLEWDKINKEREYLCAAIKERFTFDEVDVSIGGEISIDIYPEGKDKGQIADYLDGPIYFFGDKTQPGGNDYPLAARLTKKPHKVFQVSGPEEVKSILEGL